MVEPWSALAAHSSSVGQSETRLSPHCTALALPESRGSTHRSDRPSGWSSPTAPVFDQLVARRSMARAWVAAVGGRIRLGGPWSSAVRGPGDAVRGHDRDWRRTGGGGCPTGAVGRTTKRVGPRAHCDGRHASCCECPLLISRSGSRNDHTAETAARRRAHLTTHHERLLKHLRHVVVMRGQIVATRASVYVGQNRVSGMGWPVANDASLSLCVM